MLSLSKKLPCIRGTLLPWIILFFAALNVVFLGGKRRAFGSYIAQFRREFVNITLTELNWIGDSYSALGYLTSGLSTMMILHFERRFRPFQLIGSFFVLGSCVTSSLVPSPHWLFVTHTLFHGIGSSLILATVGLVVNEHFDVKHEYHLLATTLVSGGSVASILFVAFFAFLIQTYNWRVSFLILGGLYFGVNCFSALVFTKNDKYEETNHNKKPSFACGGITRLQIPLLVLWSCDRIMTAIVTYGLLLNLTDYLHRSQPNLITSTTLTTIFAAGEGCTYLIGALITALTKDFFVEKLRYILLISSTISGASLMILEFTSHSAIARQLLCFIAGFTIGPSITFLFPAGEELTKLPGHLAYPFSLGGMGVGMLLSPLLTAKIAETFKYKWFFFVQACLIFIKVFCLSLITFLLFYYRQYYSNQYLTEDISIYGEKKATDEDSLSEDTNLLSEENKKS